MKILELIRLEETGQGTIGVLKINKIVFCFTLEPPDNENLSNVSNIPAQQYNVSPYSSIKYPDVYIVDDVPNRSKILFHSGNIVDHTAGCILLGESLGKLQGNRAILNSGKTFDKFKAILQNEGHHLTVSEVY